MTVEDVKKLSLTELLSMGEFECVCGKRHSVGTKKAVIEKGAVRQLPTILSEVNSTKPFLLSGHDTFEAGGEAVCRVLQQENFKYGAYVFPHSPVKPTEQTVGSAVMHFDYGCDSIVGIGSGVINDTGKLLARVTGRPYINVATAPSMDGFASATSSMDRDGLKVSLDSTFAYAVIGDLDILTNAPMHMLQAGVGDMLAKYISLVEWRIAHLLVGEYYCPVVAALVEKARDNVVAAAPGLLRREPSAVKAVMEGLVIAGMAMKYAGLSRPASGMEHYFSHIWDMRSLAFQDAGCDLHGIQAGIGTLYSLKVYDYIRTIRPNREKAIRAVQEFSLEDWNRRLEAFIGPGAQAMIEGETREGKYDKEKHAKRLDRIIEQWDSLLEIMRTLPTYEEMYKMMTSIGEPVSAASFGYSPQELRTTFTMTKDIRDKYIASRLLWDLGYLEEAADAVNLS